MGITQKTVYNFFKFLEDERGEKIPLALKLLYDPKSLTKEDLNIKEDLVIHNILPVEELPNNLVIGNDLNIEFSNGIKRLPDDIKIGGSILAANSNLEYLPDNLYLKGDLELNNCLNIKTLPRNLVIDGSLDIEESNIKELPDDIKIGTTLYADYTDIETLPNNLTLYFAVLSNTKLKEIPYNLKIHQTLSIYNTPLTKKYTDEEIRKMIEDKGGSVRNIKSFEQMPL